MIPSDTSLPEWRQRATRGTRREGAARLDEAEWGGTIVGGMWDLFPIGAGAGVWKGDEILESRHGAD